MTLFTRRCFPSDEIIAQLSDTKEIVEEIWKIEKGRVKAESTRHNFRDLVFLEKIVAHISNTKEIVEKISLAKEERRAEAEAK